MEIITISCNDENGKINESGLDLEIDLILHELTYLYIDFEGRMNSDVNAARKQFFENENFIRMLKDMNIPFTFAGGTIYSAINTDMNNLNRYISFFEIIFNIITYFVNFVFLVFLMIMLIVNEKSGIIMEKPKPDIPFKYILAAIVGIIVLILIIQIKDPIFLLLLLLLVFFI